MFKSINKTLSSLAISCSLFQACAESDSSKSPLFVKDEGVLHGEFANGLSYYIKENRFDEKKASLRLAVKVGSICEEEEERGLAHFVEHMVFRGSTSYADGEVVKYLESIGASFGAHTNAYTSYDETVYMFDIPLNKIANLKTAIRILSEFAMKANLAKEQLEVEKKVVLDELRLRDSMSMGRMQEKMGDLLLEETLYGQRKPIGLEDVIKNCSEEKIQNFYTKWYKPENMAIIVVGDFSTEEVMTNLKECFEPLPTSSEPSIYARPNVRSFNQGKVIVHENPDNMYSYLILARWLDNYKGETLADVKEELKDSLITLIANRRLQMQVEKDPSPFQGAGVALAGMIHPKTTFLNYGICWDKTASSSVAALLKEFDHFYKESFSEKELELAVLKEKSTLENELKNASNHTNAEYAQNYLSHFMKGGMLMSFENSAAVHLSLLNEISLQEINKRKQKLFSLDDFKIIYFPSEKAEKVSKEDILKLIEEGKDRLANSEHKNEHLALTLLSKEDQGNVVGKVSFEKTSVEIMTLSNGVKIYLHPTNLKENIFSCALIADGGLNSYEENFFPSATMACYYLQKAGLAGLSNTELQDALAGKTVNLNYYMSMLNRNISGSSSNEDMDVFFKLVQSIFNHRTYKQQAWDQVMQSVDHMFDMRESNAEVKFHHLQNELNYNNHYAIKPRGSKEMSKEIAENVLEEIFGDPSEFSVVIVGDYKKDQLIGCLEKYIASIKPTKSMKNTVFTTMDFPKEVIIKSFDNMGVGAESQVVLNFPVNESLIKSEFKSFYYIQLVENILTRKFIENLRIKAGETYGVSCFTNFTFYPKLDSARFTVAFSTAPDKVQFMIDLLLEEINKSLAGSIEPLEIEKAIEIYKHRKSKALLTNEGWIDRINKNIIFKAPLDTFVSDSEDEKIVSEDHLKEMMNGLINLSNYTICIKNPKAN